MLSQTQSALRVPSLDTVLDLADQLGLPRPIANRPVFDVWFLTLHELGHYAVKPRWYRNYAEVIYWNEQRGDRPCAPLAPDLWMLCDPTPDEDCVRLWTLQVCKLMGWVNPLEANPEIFGGSNYNPRQWYVWDEAKLNQRLLKFGVDVANGHLLSRQQDIKLPHPTGVSLRHLLENHDYIYQYFQVACHTSSYSAAHLSFLTHLCKQVGKRNPQAAIPLTAL